MLRARGKGRMHTSRAVTAALPGRALDDLNWMRAIAALAVLTDHVRGAFFVDPATKPSWFADALYLATGFGQQAVIVFFVLSGFFIGTSVVVASRDGTWSWQRFALRRFSRLYVVLLPALALTAAWDTAGTRLFGLHGIYIGRIGAPLVTLPDLRTSFTLRAFAGNVAFLQDLLVPPFGSNGPLWSLSYEFWAYVTFPLLVRAALGGSSALHRTGSALCGVALLAFLGGLFPFYFAVWCLGALVAIGWSVRPLTVKNPVASVVATALLTAALLVARRQALHGRQLEAFLLGAATAVFVTVRLAVAAGEAPDDDALSRAYTRGGDALAGMSYTLYANHYPVVAFFQTLWVGGHRLTPTPTSVVLVTLFGLGVVALYAFPLARLTEAHTDDVRRWLERRVYDNRSA